MRRWQVPRRRRKHQKPQRCRRTGKTCFRNPAEARASLKRIQGERRKYGMPVRHYLCDHCGLYHLTKQTERKPYHPPEPIMPEVQESEQHQTHDQNRQTPYVLQRKQLITEVIQPEFDSSIFRRGTSRWDSNIIKEIHETHIHWHITFHGIEEPNATTILLDLKPEDDDNLVSLVRKPGILDFKHQAYLIEDLNINEWYPIIFAYYNETGQLVIETDTIPIPKK